MYTLIGTGLGIGFGVISYKMKVYEPSVFYTAGMVSAISLGLSELYERRLCDLEILKYFSGVGIGSTLGYVVYDFIQNQQCQRNESNYTPLSSEIIQYIVDQKSPIIETCAGSGENTVKLREQGVVVYSYDIHSISNVVSYGLCGTVENKHPDANILLICSGFDTERSVKNFTGNIVIIGGYAVCHTEFESVSSLTEPQLITEKQKYIMDLRPSYHTMLSLGFRFETAFFNKRNPVDNLYDVFYIFYRN
jgi:hypothetical protein